MDNNTPQKKKSYAKPLSVVLVGEIVGSQVNVFGGYVSSLLVRSEGQLPQLIDLRSQNEIPLGPWSGPVRLMIDGAWVREAKASAKVG